MIAGLPWGSWLLILLASVPGLVMGLAAYRAHGRPPASRRAKTKGKIPQAKGTTLPSKGTAADGHGNPGP